MTVTNTLAYGDTANITAIEIIGTIISAKGHENSICTWQEDKITGQKVLLCWPQFNFCRANSLVDKWIRNKEKAARNG